jgi:hypothetical protein
MPTGALPATVTVQFGFGSAPDATSPTWTDVSAYVDLNVGLTITPGRTAERSSISPRRLSFTLDNTDDRFNPRNASGPYYGDLVPRVPVRVRVNYSATDYTLYRGFVDGGWPQDFAQQARVVPIQAVDAVGWAAQAPTPRSAYEAEVARLQEVEGATLLGWIRPQSDGTWVERVSGHNWPNTAAFTRGDAGDALVDGDEEGGWATETASGGVDLSDKVPAPLFSTASPGLIVLWVRSSQTTDMVPIEIQQDDDMVRVTLLDGDGLSFLSMHGTDWRNDYTPSPLLADNWDVLDGATHMVAYSASAADFGECWVDGNSKAMASSTATVSAGTDNWTLVGRYSSSGAIVNGGQVDGAVDHITWWTDTASWSVTVEEAVTSLYEAGRLARVGDSMAERMQWLLESTGWGLVGTVDDSQIVTQQGYRRAGSVLELLQRMEDTELGRIWVDNDGQFRFSGRSWPTADTVSSTVQATFGDTGTDLPYAASLSRIVDDDRQIVNVAQVTREYGTQQTSEDATSIAAYGRRQPVTLSNLLYANDRQSKAVADWLVATHGEPQARVEVLGFSAMNEAATLVPLACQIEPGWLIRVNRDGLTFDAHVVDVGHRIGLTNWDVSLNLDASRATDLTGFTWDDGSGTVGTPWDDGTGTTSGAKGWVF